MPSRLTCVAFALMTFACHHAQAPSLLITVPPTVLLDTMEATRVVSISTTMVNASNDTLMISTCDQTLEYLDGKTWRRVDMTPCAGLADPVWVVPPRDSLVRLITKEDSRDMRLVIRRGPLVTGTYRLGFDAYRSSSRPGQRRSTVRMNSVPFTIQVKDGSPVH